MATLSDIEIRQKRRLCKVGDELGYFHTWEHYSEPLAATIVKGGAPAGVFSKIFGETQAFVKMMYKLYTYVTKADQIKKQCDFQYHFEGSEAQFCSKMVADDYVCYEVDIICPECEKCEHYMVEGVLQND